MATKKDFKIGDKVICTLGHIASGLIHGKTYTVSKVNHDGQQDCWLHLEEIKVPPTLANLGFGAWRFDKVESKKLEENNPLCHRGPKPEPDEEDRAKVIAFFRPQADKHTCGSCGAPMPCQFH